MARVNMWAMLSLMFSGTVLMVAPDGAIALGAEASSPIASMLTLAVFATTGIEDTDAWRRSPAVTALLLDLI